MNEKQLYDFILGVLYRSNSLSVIWELFNYMMICGIEVPKELLVAINNSNLAAAEEILHDLIDDDKTI